MSSDLRYWLSSMSLIDKLETKFGHFAIPGLVKILAGFQAVVWVLLVIQPRFLEFLHLDRSLVLSGEVWRLLTWVFIPMASGPIGMFFMIWVLILFGNGLEAAWGPFRTNLYVLGWVLAGIIGAMVFGYNPLAVTLSTTLLFAFAMLYPNHELMLFLVLPVKVKYLALISAAILMLSLVNASMTWRMTNLFGVMNFLVTFGPLMIRSWLQHHQTSQRKAQFKAASEPEESHFHKCEGCGKTDVTDPKLEFRVTAKGEELCADCLAKWKDSSAVANR